MTTHDTPEFDYGRRFHEIERSMVRDWQDRHPRSARGNGAEALAVAMLEARAGASGDFDSAEQLRRTILMAEWVIARLPFHGLALVEEPDGLTDDVREANYRAWLRRAK